ncbi:MAG: MATE family efflux transporter [Gammaproteobacteria bacterium]|nr:MATE family efflux transporter [Gammaproteobacteria bacterium]
MKKRAWQTDLLDFASHKKVFMIVVPMVLSGVSTPLLGMVDTALMGHLDQPYYLGAVAVGALAFSFLYWGFGFLRMSVTGLTAQALGASDTEVIVGTLVRGLLFAAVIGIFLLLAQGLVIRATMWLVDTSANVENGLSLYLAIRLWSAPAAFINYVLVGWFLGVQRPAYTLYLLLLVNLTNIVLDIVFVYVWSWDISGVAWASVFAEYLGCIFGLFLTKRIVSKRGWVLTWRNHIQAQKFRSLFQLSGNIFIRTLCLIGSFAFFTIQGARYGEIVLAANAILMNLQTFMAYALDGFAHAAEALVGKSIGERDYAATRRSIVICVFWSALIAASFVLAYALFGPSIINLLTDLPEVREAALIYLPWAIIAPLLSVWSYVLDGIFVGAAWSVLMRNTMVVSTLIFLVTWYVLQEWGNHGLWLAFMVFMSARGMTMAWVFFQRKHQLQVM